MTDTPEAVIREALIWARMDAEADGGATNTHDGALAALDALVAENARLTADLSRVTHLWECAGTPLMSDVMGERDEALRVADELRADLMCALVAFYSADYVECARVCDEKLDPSGALLGRVRAATLSSEGQPRE